MCSEDLAQKACGYNHGLEYTKIHRACLVTETTEGFFGPFSFFFRHYCVNLPKQVPCTPSPWCTRMLNHEKSSEPLPANVSGGTDTA